MTVEPYRSPTLQARRAQMFPVLADEDIARLRRFGAPRRYADGECLFETGKTSPGMFVVLSGTLRITGRDGHGHGLLIAELSAGGFSGEIGQLSGRRALADGVAAGAVEALLVVPEQQRTQLDRKSTRLNSSHLVISYAVFCLKKKKKYNAPKGDNPDRAESHAEGLNRRRQDSRSCGIRRFRACESVRTLDCAVPRLLTRARSA